MTYQKIKEKLVDTDKVLTEKELKRLTTRLALFVMGLCVLLSFLTLKVFGTGLTIIVIFMSILSYLWVFDFMIEDVNVLQKFQKFLRFWFLPYIAFIAEFLVLTFFRF